MATIRSCPDCGKGGMLVVRETYHRHGRWVWYRCRNSQCRGTLEDFDPD